MISQYVNLYFPISSLILNILLCIIFFSKQKIKNIDNNIYSIILIIGLIESFLMFMTNLFVCFYYIPENYIFFELLNKTLYSIYIIWITVLFIYIYKIGTNKSAKIINIISTIINICIIILIFKLPITLYYSNGLTNSSGPSSNALYVGCSLYIVIMVITALINYKKIDNKKKYLPLLFLIILMTIMMIIRQVDPLLNISSNILSIISFIMYFTIENPDIKTIKELKFTKTLLEKENNATIKGFNDLALNLKEPLNKLTNFGNMKISKENLDQEIKNIQKETLTLVDEINSIIDLTRIENNIIENNLNYYKTEELYEGIKEIIDNKKIKAEYQISDSIPNTLYGNINKIKQIIIYLTNFIDKSFTKYNLLIKIDKYQVGNICKLKFSFIIPIENLKSTIKLININNKYILDNKDIEYTIYEKLLEIDNNKSDILNIDNFISFNFQIYNKLNNNYIEDSINLNNEVEYFNLSNKRILIMDDNRKNIKKLVDMLTPYNVNIDISTNIEELINQIESNKTYDLILYSDTINTIKEYNIDNENIPHIISRLKLIAGYKIPLVIIGNKKYKNIDYIIKPLDIYELNNIILKYLKDNYIK